MAAVLFDDTDIAAIDVELWNSTDLPSFNGMTEGRRWHLIRTSGVE